MNKTTRCLIVDDEPLAIEVIKEHISKIPSLEVIGTCKDAMDAYEWFNRTEIDLLFIDIEMPNLNGIEFVKSLSNPPHVILTTAYRDYALESYDINVIDYLLKPISFNRLFKSITKYQDLRKSSTASAALTSNILKSGSIYVYADKKNVKVHYDDIHYIESIKDYVRICTSNGNLISKSTLSHYDQTLPDGFIRVHRSFIVNTDKISAYTNHDIEIGPKQIPISSGYKKTVLERLGKT